MQQILEAVAHCHYHNIIHRDIKPENLLMANNNSDADIKLVDFGLAVECTEGKNEYFGFAGTPGYLAPEVAQKIPYGKQVDVWACGTFKINIFKGVILYILLSGYPPFWDEDQLKLLAKIIEQPLIFHYSEWEKTSNEAKSLISRMTEKNPSFRISVFDALNDPWIKALLNREKVASKINRQETLISLKKFNARRKLKGAIISTILTNKFTKGRERGFN
ncbi:hypothetical protein MXB_3455 [Myxobolus squamalis]|nr:hypothetical protein MXB_3455 [Myxobolus squamalis]